MSRSLNISPVVSLALAFASAGLVAVSLPAFGVVATALVLGLAVADGRRTTAGALVGGWAIAAGGALFTLSLTSLHPPPNSHSSAGLAFIVFPMLVGVLGVTTALVFAAAHVVRRRKTATG